MYVVYDSDPPDPRDDDNLGIMVCAHKHYFLGDETARNLKLYSSWEEWLEEEIIKPNGGTKNVIALPLYMYDHGGITIDTCGFSHCDPAGWDWGQVGYIYTTRERILREFGVKRITAKIRNRVEEILRREVEEYDKYLRGEFYGFVRKTREGEIIDCCFGFLTIEDMVDALSGEAKQLLLKFLNKRKSA